MEPPITGDSVIDGTYRILIVEDNPDTLRLIRDKLDLVGFEVLTALSGQEGLDVISRHGLPHLAIVDILMPGINGFEFSRQVQEFCDLPIIFLTAIDEEETVIEGIERFAEDYIIKPFSPRELVARIRRVLRRIGDFGYTLQRLTKVDERLSVDFVQQQAVIDNEKVPLTPRETKLLYILMRNAGRTITTDFLLRRLWALDDVSEPTLRVHVHRLRHKIEADPNTPHYIITERGMGYTFPLYR